MEQLRGIERGTLRVGASATVGIYVVPLALGAHKRRHPKLAVSLEIGTREHLESRGAGVSLPVGMELGSNGAIKHAVEAGLGVAVLSRHAIELERRQGGLLVVDVAGFPIRRQWSVIRLRRQRLPGPVQGFIEFLCSGEWQAR
jgi:DNA-binding transcriptional LysR family regulator